ncbi:phosphoglucosamine mutase [Halocatena halophila]|uniref:phosphoglucosamine mutase n=1 Tax=Halocatena halophila TaxID=2814576 RepID=UPI002ED006E8
MFGTSGIRGPVGETVTASLALAVGRAVGLDADRIVVGRDSRESGKLLKDAFTAGVREVGADVVDLSLAATPTVGRAVDWYDCDAGCSITASHNPAPDNGLKLWQPGGQAFDETRRSTIETRLEDDLSTELASAKNVGSLVQRSATDRHREALINAVELPADETPHVIVDLGNGAGGVTVDALIELGCHVETINGQPDGRFPGRESEPTAESLASLSELVGTTDADLGIAHDGDADRMLAVDGSGKFIPKDALLAILAAEATEPDDAIAVPVDTSMAVADFLAENDVDVEYTPVGDVYVAAAVGEGVPFGGEPSGAWIWPEQTRCPDGPLAALRLVELATKQPLKARLSAFEPYAIRRSNVETDDKEATMDAVREGVRAAFDDKNVTTLDGVRVDLGDGWFLIRASGTQPLVRVTAEASTPSRAEEVFDRAMSVLD